MAGSQIIFTAMKKLYAKIVMAPGYELEGTNTSYITKDDFTVTKVGSGEDSHYVYELDGFTLPGGITLILVVTLCFKPINYRRKNLQ